MPKNKKLVEDERNELKSPPVSLDERQRAVVERAIREVCDYRGYKLFAINVRTNHVHSVVYARCKPEPVMDAFKAYATRQLRRRSPKPECKTLVATRQYAVSLD